MHQTPSEGAEQRRTLHGTTNKPNEKGDTMPVVLARIDNRLLHGIVATQWAPKAGAQRVMVIDDETAANPLAKNSMKLARPAGAAISIIGLDTAIANFKAGKYEGQTIFLLTKQPTTILKLIDATGASIPELNVGATAQREKTPELIEVNHFVTVNPEERAAYLELISRGVNVYAQYLAADKPQPLADVLA